MNWADLAGYLPAAGVGGAIVALGRQLIANRVPLRKVKLEGEEALWNQIWKLHSLIEKKDSEHRAELARERADCDQRISSLESKIRQLEQQSRSLGILAGNMPPLGSELNAAFPIPTDDMPLPRGLRGRKRNPDKGNHDD